MGSFEMMQKLQVEKKPEHSITKESGIKSSLNHDFFPRSWPKVSSHSRDSDVHDSGPTQVVKTQHFLRLEFPSLLLPHIRTAGLVRESKIIVDFVKFEIISYTSLQKFFADVPLF